MKLFNFAECLCLGLMTIGVPIAAVCWVVPLLGRLSKKLFGPKWLYGGRPNEHTEEGVLFAALILLASGIVTLLFYVGCAVESLIGTPSLN